MSRLKIAFVGIGSFSHINPSLLTALRQSFPEHQIDWIDVVPLVERNPGPFLINSSRALWEFRDRIARHPGEWLKRWHWTNYLFDRRSRAAAQRIAAGCYQFSIQTQSLFDASVPGIPNFIYTDNTMLANLQSESASRNDLPVSNAWLARERSTYDHAHACFVMSTNVARSLTQDYSCSNEKVICAYAGQNCDTEQNGQKQLDQKNILFVGLNWMRKGGPTLLQAFRLVRAQIPDATLTIAGCAPKIDEPGCKVLGRLPLSEVAQHYRDASVFCLPTLREPFGIVFLEAMAHGLPIVGTDVGALPDFILNGENGYRVKPGDARALAGFLVKLLQDPLLCRRMGERSRTLSKKYRWDNVASIMRNTIASSVPGLESDTAFVSGVPVQG